MSKKIIEFSSDLIKNNIKNDYKLEPVFYSVYAFFSVNVNRFNNQGMISVSKIYKYLSYKQFKRNATFYKVIESIKELEKRKMITLQNISSEELDKIPFNTAIEYEITNSFYDREGFTTLSYEYFHYIFESDNLIVKKENAFLVLLYLASNIWVRAKGDYKDIDLRPEATYGTYNYLSKKIGLSYKTVYNCVEYLTSEWNDHKPILKTKVCKLVIDEDNVINCPTIYAYNTKEADTEIEWCEKLLLKNKLKFYKELN